MKHAAPLATVTAALAGVTAALAGATAAAADPVADLIAALKSDDDAVRGPAWQRAGGLGAPAVSPLIALMADPAFESARAAKRALWQIVHQVGRPGAEAESAPVVAELLSRVRQGETAVRRELLWMLSEIAGDEAVDTLAGLLTDPDVREDARCALQRMPGSRATAALDAAFARVPEDFKYALADSLRARGLGVSGYASRKLVPTRTTELKPLPAQ